MSDENTLASQGCFLMSGRERSRISDRPAKRGTAVLCRAETQIGGEEDGEAERITEIDCQ